MRRDAPSLVATGVAAAGVRAYPTWVIGGQKLEGEISPAELGRLSNFEG